MKFFGLLRKPDWENKDAAVRLRAVQGSRDAALLARLPELAQTDPDPRVRAAALRRVDDAGLLERRLRGDNDAGVAAAARERLIERLCLAELDVQSAQAVLLHVHDPEVLAQVAERSPHAPLRRTALERIERPSLRIARCIHDPDPELRLWLLQKIDQPEALAKIAEAVRKRDKRLSRAARDKLDELQLAAGDDAALQRRVLAVCERAGRLARELPAQRDALLLELQAEWAGLRAQVAADLQRRADGSLAMAEAAVRAARGEPIPGRAGAATVEAPLPAAAEVAPAPVPAPAQPDPALEALFAELPDADAEDFDTLADALLARAAQHPDSDNAAVQAQQLRLRKAVDERRQQRARQQAAAQAEREQQQEQQLAALEQALQQGHLGAARHARAAIDARHCGRALQRRLGQADEGLAKLERWQRWAGSEARQRLCEQAEALHGSGLHPDALANRVKELQAEWSRLDGIDGAAAPGPEHGLSRRFRGLCQRALAPARPYFEKRRELRGERTGQIQALLQEVMADDASLDALLAARKRIRDALAELDGVAPEKRHELGRQLRERLAALDAALKAQREQAALGKRRLIARLRRDLGSAEGAAALALAKAAQAEWRQLPRSERALEDALWKELRELIDPLFARVREQDAAQRARAGEAEAAAQAILDELDALAAAEPERLLHAGAHLEALQARWRALTPAVDEAEPAARPPRDARAGKPRPLPRRGGHPWDARFEAASTRVQAAQAAALRARERAQLEAICAAGAVLDQLAAAAAEQRESLHHEFQRIELPADARGPLQQRCQALLDGAAAASADGTAQAELLAVRAELAAGLDSPAECAELRRQEQMRRLADKLGGRGGESGPQQARALLIELQALGLATPDRERLQQRILRAARAG